MNEEKNIVFDFIGDTADVEVREPVVIGITHGDINGVNYEVIIKSLYDKEILSLITPVIYGSSKVLNYFQKQLHAVDFQYFVMQNTTQLNKKKINIVNIFDQEIKLDIGKSNDFAGSLAVRALEQAVNDLKKGIIKAVVTAPINKSNVQSKDFNFSGHTEYFADRFNTPEQDTLMLMVHDNLRIGLITNHLPLNEVSKSLSKDLIVHKIHVMDDSLMRDFGIVKPRIAVLSLNPHAGENGFLGSEEQDIIEPAIKQCFDKKMLVYGPYAADGFFGSGNYRHFDAVLAMYHDQGLIAFKSIAEGEGINFTAGLPIVRTSPAHGTAYEIAGQNAASHASMQEAIFMACEISQNRDIFLQMNKNPLKLGIAQEITGYTRVDETIDPFAEEAE
ncbi:MAG: 4-hydroxythreonine-4-phosphate dehydrogenase PdxA [Bacteroidales bacterium]|jgi:4-hydroxythreonine-4-phosphate dehydrogenase|nr:4-hydroxythreonine-4-phosphate dehydrogenase PdxA [Bacteroidales bacterium]